MVAGLTFPFRHNNTVLRLQRRVLWVRVEEDDFAEVTVQIREILESGSSTCGSVGFIPETYLDDLSLDVSRGFTVQLVRQIRLEWVQLFRNGHSGLRDRKVSLIS